MTLNELVEKALAKVLDDRELTLADDVYVMNCGIGPDGSVWTDLHLPGDEWQALRFDLELETNAMATQMLKDSGAKTLKQLIDEYGADAVVIADRGNGSAKGEQGICCRLDDNMLTEYGDILLTRLDESHTSDDGYVCHWASEWFDSGLLDERIFF